MTQPARVPGVQSHFVDSASLQASAEEQPAQSKLGTPTRSAAVTPAAAIAQNPLQQQTQYVSDFPQRQYLDKLQPSKPDPQTSTQDPHERVYATDPQSRSRSLLDERPSRPQLDALFRQEQQQVWCVVGLQHTCTAVQTHVQL